MDADSALDAFTVILAQYMKENAAMFASAMFASDPIFAAYKKGTSTTEKLFVSELGIDGDW